MNEQPARTLIMIGTFLASTAIAMMDTAPASTTTTAPRCGFYQLSRPIRDLTARYVHCAGTFILIKFHWNNGNAFTSCEPPWSDHPFYADGPYRVVNAYYVPTPPRLGNSDGRVFCLTSQPQV
ncbi:DUF6355 family natural product biosynthesis protein [Lentzea sp. NPDC006480]|uniref:DUF6355 family natural product biosynthesis protein n=1 Tax=Lentzea sp. NPDC006480 TaxID=3157176 RepID=UPI0033A37231